jgi:hypothetical protein
MAIIGLSPVEVYSERLGRLLVSPWNYHALSEIEKADLPDDPHEFVRLFLFLLAKRISIDDGINFDTYDKAHGLDKSQLDALSPTEIDEIAKQYIAHAKRIFLQEGVKQETLDREQLGSLTLRDTVLESLESFKESTAKMAHHFSSMKISKELQESIINTSKIAGSIRSSLPKGILGEIGKSNFTQDSRLAAIESMPSLPEIRIPTNPAHKTNDLLNDLSRKIEVLGSSAEQQITLLAALAQTSNLALAETTSSVEQARQSVEHARQSAEQTRKATTITKWSVIVAVFTFIIQTGFTIYSMFDAKYSASENAERSEKLIRMLSEQAEANKKDDQARADKIERYSQKNIDMQNELIDALKNIGAHIEQQNRHDAAPAAQ